MAKAIKKYNLDICYTRSDKMIGGFLTDYRDDLVYI